MGVAARIDAARANIAVDFFITLFKTVPPLSVVVQRETERIPLQEREEGLIKRYKKHVGHAIKFLRPGGRLICILPASAYYDHGNTVGEWHDLPVGSFADSGTNIPTGYCTYYAPNRRNTKRSLRR